MILKFIIITEALENKTVYLAIHRIDRYGPWWCEERSWAYTVTVFISIDVCNAMFVNFIVMNHLSERKFLPTKKPIELLISQVFSTVFPCSIPWKMTTCMWKLSSAISVCSVQYHWVRFCRGKKKPLRNASLFQRVWRIEENFGQPFSPFWPAAGNSWPQVTNGITEIECTVNLPSFSIWSAANYFRCG